MKKNITINLCGRLFQIDEDAYEVLQKYIESLRSYFGRQEGGDEIADDIEARIAELFDELRQQGVEAITIDHVKDIITRIGKPEQLAGGGDDDNPNDNVNSGHKYDSFHSAAEGIREEVRSRTAGKKLYRNPKDKMLAGVLSGLAAYTNTDPAVWRLATVLLFLFYGFGLLVYIVLAIILPEARTPEQLLQMEGRDVTPQNLADVVVDKDKPYEERPSVLRNLLSILLKIFVGIFVGIAVICGLALLVCLLLVVISMVIVFTVPAATRMSLPFDIGYLNLPELFAVHPWIVIAFIASLLLVFFIPLYAIGHMLLSKSGKTQPMGTGQRIVWIVLWIAALCCMIPSFIWINEKASEHYQAEYAKNHAYQGVLMSDEDKDFLRQGGWKLLKHDNCAHYTYSGDYYNGDTSVRYLDAWDENCMEVFQAERKEAVEPGIYKLSCIARAEGPGPCIYAIGDDKQLVQIPVYGDKGGELAAQIRQLQSDSLSATTDTPSGKRVTHRVQMNVMGIKFEVNHDDELKINDEVVDQYRVKQGMGWSVVTIDNIVVKGDSIAYGVSTDKSFTGRPCQAKWFSATDFKLTRTGDLP
ncbi:MAG: PspC domain-containing protein [Prevotella sp.]|nr:PspC domain-containing protein [Prevotella sp.]